MAGLRPPYNVCVGYSIHTFIKHQNPLSILKWISGRVKMAVEIISWPIYTTECYQNGGSNLWPSTYQAEAHLIELTGPAFGEVNRRFYGWTLHFTATLRNSDHKPAIYLPKWQFRRLLSPKIKFKLKKMSDIVNEPEHNIIYKMMCTQQRLRSDCAFIQSEKCTVWAVLFEPMKKLYILGYQRRLIRLCGCVHIIL